MQRAVHPFERAGAVTALARQGDLGGELHLTAVGTGDRAVHRDPDVEGNVVPVQPVEPGMARELAVGQQRLDTPRPE